VVLGVGALVAGSVVVGSLGRPPSVQSIAVMPLRPLRPDSAVEYLTDGMTESVIHSLSQTSRLRVLAPSTVFRYKGAVVEPREVGRTLGVDAVLLWEAEELGDRLVIRTELVRTADGAELWGGRYVRPPTGLLAMPEEIAGQVVDGLRLRLTGEDRPRAVAGHTRDLEAFRLYLRGRYAWNRRDEGGLWAAIRSFDSAVARDPTFALAFVGLADAYIVLGHQSLLPPEDAYPRARAAALRALEIDSTLAEAHAALGVVRGRYEWQWRAKVDELERAIALNPSYATAYQWYAIGLETLGRNDEAIASVRRAHELDPLSPITGTSLGHRLYFARRYREAAEQYRAVLRFEPSFTQAHIGLGWALLEQGDYQTAVSEFQQALDHSGGRQGLEPLAVATARAGRTGEARSLLARLHGLAGERYVSPAALAEIYAALGEPDSAFAWLVTARRRHADEIVLLRNNPRLDPLRADPRFRALLREVGLEGR
jgi:TolB-like protein/Tfp pilus assembly protein PilF